MVAYLFPQTLMWTMKECPIHEAQYVLAKVQGQDVTSYRALRVIFMFAFISRLIAHAVQLQLYNKRQLICKVSQVKSSKVQVHTRTFPSLHEYYY